MTKFLFFCMLLQFVCKLNGVVIPPNPCSPTFEYAYEKNKWYGIITAPSPTVGTGQGQLIVSANFSIPDINLPDYGSINVEDQDNALNRIKKGLPVIYKVQLPNSKHIAQVTSVNIDGRVVCSGPSVKPPSTSFWLQHTLNWTITVTYVPNSPSSNQTVKPLKNKFKNMPNCGSPKRTTRAANVVPYIIKGKPVARNAHPWLAALYEDSLVDPRFFCGGNLITNKHVITAAHCTVSKTKVHVKLGAHHKRELFEPGSLLISSESILQHPNYVHNSGHGDLSVIFLSETVEFSNTVIPICLWNSEAELSRIVGQSGTIMGWGLNENGEATSTPMQTDVTIVSQEDCRRVKLLRNSISDSTFCAGTKGTGPCMGDSGGGLFMLKDGRWYMRGIISTSLADSAASCDVNTVSVYADIAKYVEWLATVIT